MRGIYFGGGVRIEILVSDVQPFSMLTGPEISVSPSACSYSQPYPPSMEIDFGAFKLRDSVKVMARAWEDGPMQDTSCFI